MKLEFNFLKIKKLFLKKSGQSLVEVLLALGISGILIAAAAGAISLALRQELETRTSQTANAIADALLDNIKTATQSNWHLIYNLQKGSTSKYFVIASTTPVMVLGEESVAENAPISGLVANWKFDETSGTTAYDSSGNYYNGAAIGTTITASSSCKIGKCLLFNGTNSNVNAGDNLEWQGAITVSTWSNRVVKDTTSADSIVGNWYWQSDASLRRGWVQRYYINTDSLCFIIELTNGSSVEEKSACFSPNLNTWVNAVGVFNPADGTIKLYVDGVLKSSNTASSGFNQIAQDSSYPMRVGYNPVNSGYFNGYIDDVRIYNRALSADEISSLYKSRIFTRSFYVEDVNRDSGGNISDTGTDDPSTQKITTTVSWSGDRTLSKSQYFTRSTNKIFNQGNWSGGGGQTSIILEPNNMYDTSTNALITSSGTIKVILPE